MLLQLKKYFLQYERYSFVSIPQAVGVVATREQGIDVDSIDVSIPQAVGVVATDVVDLYDGHYSGEFQYRKR